MIGEKDTQEIIITLLPNETDIKKVIVTGYINDDGSIEDLDTEVEFEMYDISKKHILEEIEYDVESLM